jgi:antitoxin (DNA-binding transcriptional repressor) of toxin-antitoxin stability system
MATLTSRDFNQDVSHAKREAERGPVVITDRGKPSHVLLTFAAYQALKRSSRSIGELLALPADVAFEPADLSGHEFFRPAQLED